MGHSPYSPDLKPNELGIFSYEKNIMRGQAVAFRTIVLYALLLIFLNQCDKSASTNGSNSCERV